MLLTLPKTSMHSWPLGWGGGLLVSLPTKSPKVFSVLSSQLVPTEKFFCFWRHHVLFFPPPKKPHLQLFQDIQLKNQAVEKSHQIWFFMCDPCVCLWLLSAENLAGQGKSLHPLLSGSSASCRHTAAVSHQPQGHRVRGGNRTVDSFIRICVWFFLRSHLFFPFEYAECAWKCHAWGSMNSPFPIQVVFLFFHQNETARVQPDPSTLKAHFLKFSRVVSTEMVRDSYPTNSQQSWMVLYHFVPKTQQSICSIDRTLCQLLKNPFELFLELKEVCSVAQCR